MSSPLQNVIQYDFNFPAYKIKFHNKIQLLQQLAGWEVILFSPFF